MVYPGNHMGISILAKGRNLPDDSDCTDGCQQKLLSERKTYHCTFLNERLPSPIQRSKETKHDHPRFLLSRNISSVHPKKYVITCKRRATLLYKMKMVFDVPEDSSAELVTVSSSLGSCSGFSGSSDLLRLSLGQGRWFSRWSLPSRFSSNM